MPSVCPSLDAPRSRTARRRRALPLSLPLALGLLAFAAGFAAPREARALNSSSVVATLEIEFSGAYYTTSGFGLVEGSDYDFSFLDSFGTEGLFEQGTGARSSSGSALAGGVPFDQYNGTFPFGETFEIQLTADASASGAGSQFTGAYTEETTLEFVNYVSDLVTYVFNYTLTWSMDLAEPDPGQAVGFIDATLDLNGGTIVYSSYVDLAFGTAAGTTANLGNVETGQLQFELDNTNGDFDTATFAFLTEVLANAQTAAVPEPGAGVLIASGLAWLAARGRRRGDAQRAPGRTD